MPNERRDQNLAEPVSVKKLSQSRYVTLVPDIRRFDPRFKSPFLEQFRGFSKPVPVKREFAAVSTARPFGLQHEIAGDFIGVNKLRQPPLNTAAPTMRNVEGWRAAGGNSRDGTRARINLVSPKSITDVSDRPGI